MSEEDEIGGETSYMGDVTIESEQQQAPDEDLLIPMDDYLASGVHIGTQQKNRDMEEYIYRARTDGLYVMDVQKTDEKIRVAGPFIANFPPEQVLIVSARQYGKKPISKFAEVTGILAKPGRFTPGTLTNPNLKEFMEIGLLIATDPRADAQAISETRDAGIPVIALCDSDNETSNVDLVIPTNNKGKKALSTVYWLLAREVLMARGAISDRENFESTAESFEGESIVGEIA
jgi:small subunit ribosomal protein S2